MSDDFAIIKRRGPALTADEESLKAELIEKFGLDDRHDAVLASAINGLSFVLHNGSFDEIRKSSLIEQHAAELSAPHVANHWPGIPPDTVQKIVRTAAERIRRRRKLGSKADANSTRDPGRALHGPDGKPLRDDEGNLIENPYSKGSKMNAYDAVIAKRKSGADLHQGDVRAVLLESAQEIVKRDPKITLAKAYDLAVADPDNRGWAQLLRVLPPDPGQPVSPPEPIAKRNHGAAYAELVAKAAELRKAKPALTEAQAFAQAYQDRANAEIVKRYRDEQAAA